MTSDPVVRYTAGAILVVAFLAAAAVAVHGYWTDPAYVIPPIVTAILSGGVTGALTLLGIHIGSASTTSTVNATAKLVQGVQDVVTNGKGAEAHA